MKQYFKRKIYQTISEWKNAMDSMLFSLNRPDEWENLQSSDNLLRMNIGHIYIDFSETSQEVHDLFGDMHDIDFFFLRLQTIFGRSLHKRESLIVFDEVQFEPKARQAIKYLVADGRYDYIETGSLISIRKNVKDMLLPYWEFIALAISPNYIPPL